MKKKKHTSALKPMVKKHLKEDMEEFREQIQDDKHLLKAMKGKLKSRARSK